MAIIAERDRYKQALIDIAGLENWQPVTAGHIAAEALKGTGAADAERQREIDGAVARWHCGSSDQPLHEYLGWTWEQYKRHVEDPTYCPPVAQGAA